MPEANFEDSWVGALVAMDVNPGEYPKNEWALKKWMGRKTAEKRAFAPWSSWDEPARCSQTDCPAEFADEPACECNAQYKWGWEGHYRTGEQLEVAMTVPEWELDGGCFIQQDDDEYMYIDMDQVVDSEGRVHPIAVALLAHLRPTYCEVSLSGTGLHALYRGELPAWSGEPKWQLDDQPWGNLNRCPHIELYDSKRLLIMTGDHIVGTPESAEQIRQDALVKILKTNTNADVAETSNLRGSSNEDFAEKDDAKPIHGTTTAVERTTDPEVVMEAVNGLDARQVAAETIVKEWTDRSRRTYSFLPIWGSLDDRGTANIVNPDVWKDTGHLPGYGGPVAMAAIDLGLIHHQDAAVGCVDGYEWVQSVRHLHEMGFDVPYLEFESGDVAPEVEQILDEKTAGWRLEPEHALEAWVHAREEGALPADATPPDQVYMPVIERMTGDSHEPHEVPESVMRLVKSVVRDLDSNAIGHFLPKS